MSLTSVHERYGDAGWLAKLVVEADRVPLAQYLATAASATEQGMVRALMLDVWKAISAKPQFKAAGRQGFLGRYQPLVLLDMRQEGSSTEGAEVHPSHSSRAAVPEERPHDLKCGAAEEDKQASMHTHKHACACTCVCTHAHRHPLP